MVIHSFELIRLQYVIMMFVAFDNNTKGVTSGAGTATLPEHLNSSSIFSF
jgi:hypothetical protein